MCEVSLNVQVQDGGRSGRAQRRTVLAQQVLELLTDLPGRQREEGGGGRKGGEALPSVTNTTVTTFVVILPLRPPPSPSFQINQHGESEDETI